MSTVQPLGNYPVLQIAYTGAAGPIEAYKILATYYSAASSVVVAVPVEGIFSTTTRSDFDSNTIHSLASLPAGFTIGTIPASLAGASKCGVRLRGFIRGPQTAAAVYTFTVALLVRGSRECALPPAAVAETFESLTFDSLPAVRHGSRARLVRQCQ